MRGGGGGIIYGGAANAISRAGARLVRKITRLRAWSLQLWLILVHAHLMSTILSIFGEIILSLIIARI